MHAVCPARKVFRLLVFLDAGHRNYRTVKGVSFAGASDEYIASGSDDGHIYMWSRDGVLRQWLEGDRRVVNCIEPHPQLPLVMATSGVHPTQSSEHVQSCSLPLVQASALTSCGIENSTAAACPDKVVMLRLCWQRCRPEACGHPARRNAECYHSIAEKPCSIVDLQLASKIHADVIWNQIGSDRDQIHNKHH